MKKTIISIIDLSDLDNVTMKTVIQEVHSKYPNKDLKEKIPFIKSAVKEVFFLKTKLYKIASYRSCNLKDQWSYDINIFLN